ncbi:MAG: hypothetical protein ACW968_07985 [Candidatus Thorarchaeota archaeon]|jgi:hypothetical protein
MSEGGEAYKRNREYRESEEEREVDETKEEDEATERYEDAQEKAREIAREFEEEEETREKAREIAREFEEEEEARNRNQEATESEDEFEKEGLDHKEAEDRLDEEFADDAKDKIDDWERNSKETQETDEETSSQTGNPAEGDSYHDGGNGMAYAVRHEGGSESGDMTSEIEDSELEKESDATEDAMNSEVEEPREKSREDTSEGTLNPEKPESGEVDESNLHDNEPKAPEHNTRGSMSKDVEDTGANKTSSEHSSDVSELDELNSDNEEEESTETSSIEEPEIEESADDESVNESEEDNESSENTENSPDRTHESQEYGSEISNEAEQDSVIDEGSEETSEISETDEHDSQEEIESVNETEEGTESASSEEPITHTDESTETEQSSDDEGQEQISEKDESESETSENQSPYSDMTWDNSRSEFIDMSWKNNQYSDMGMKSQYEGMKWGSLFGDDDELCKDERKLEEARKLLDELTETKIETVEELKGAVEQRPELREDMSFEVAYEYAKQYLEFKQKVKKKYTKEEFEELSHVDMAREFGYRIADVSNWYRGIIPELISNLEKLERESRRNEIINAIWGETVETKEAVPKSSERVPDARISKTFREFKSLLKKYPDQKEKPSFERFYNQARIYYKIKKELQKGNLHNLSARQRWKILASRHGVSEYTVKGWFAKGKLPRLVNTVISSEYQKIRQERNRQPKRGDVETPDSLNAYLILLRRHPYLMDRPGFERNNQSIKAYFEMKDLLKQNPSLKTSELTRILNVPRGMVGRWRLGKTIPRLLTQLMKNEGIRRKLEHEMPSEAFDQWIDPSSVYQSLRDVGINGLMDIERIADALKNLYIRMGSHSPVSFAHLKPYNMQDGPRWLLDISNEISLHREEIVNALNEKLGFDVDSNTELRIAIVDTTLFFWNYMTSEFDSLSLLAEELFFFNKGHRKMLSNRARKLLGLRGDYNFSELIRQICNYAQTGKASEDGIISDLKSSSSHLMGKVLKFFLSIMRKDLKDIEHIIERIGVGQQIVRPVFLDEDSLLILMSRLFAIIGSDGSVEQNGRLYYYEKDPNRRQRVRDLVGVLGELHTPVIKNKDGSEGGFRLPNILGRLLIRLGMVVGDKSLQHMKLPDFIKYGTALVQHAYLEELIPEEGWISISDDDYPRIGLSRTVVLYDPLKGSKFGHVPKLTADHVQFIRENGKRKVRSYGKSGVADVFRELSMGELQKYQKSDNLHDVKMAHEIESIVRSNSSKYLDDEVFLCESIGIMMREPEPSLISMSEATDRISVKWQTRTVSREDVAMWGIVAPPNDVRKRKILKDWMQRNDAVVEIVKKKLRNADEKTRTFLELSENWKKEGIEEA